MSIYYKIKHATERYTLASEIISFFMGHFTVDSLNQANTVIVGTSVIIEIISIIDKSIFSKELFTLQEK